MAEPHTTTANTPSAPSAAAELVRLLGIMARLRDPLAGCPWDIAQDFRSIAPYTVEEAHEVADAIERGDIVGLRGELGDLLFQVVYHARMAEEQGLFDFAAVAAGIADKMISRHPHVFGDPGMDPPAPATPAAIWEARKADERRAANLAGTLDGIALALPALSRAVKLQARAARVGFDWPGPAEVLDKIAEESRELVEAHAAGDQAHLAEDFGDLLFVMANLARHLEVDPEAALRGANAKFTRRFARIEALLAAEGRRPEDSTLAEMDALWNRAKAEERAPAAVSPAAASPAPVSPAATGA
jgi:ATP diphosphatase